MKRIVWTLSILFGAALSTVVKADFYAYQEWVNPQTGQILKEYYDVHTSKDCLCQSFYSVDEACKCSGCAEKIHCEDMPAYCECNNDSVKHALAGFGLPTVRKQQFDFLHEAKKHEKDGLCLVEDPLPLVGHKIEKRYKGYSMSPLAGLTTLLSYFKVPISNIECRYLEKFLSEAKAKLHAYDDGSILNKYYQRIIDLDATGTFHDIEWLFVDAIALHEIYNTDKSHIQLAAGAAHIANINKILYRLGWQPKRPIISEGLKTLLDCNHDLACTENNLFDYQNAFWLGTTNESLPLVGHQALDIGRIHATKNIFDVCIPLELITKYDQCRLGQDTLVPQEPIVKKVKIMVMPDATPKKDTSSSSPKLETDKTLRAKL